MGEAGERVERRACVPALVIPVPRTISGGPAELGSGLSPAVHRDGRQRGAPWPAGRGAGETRGHPGCPASARRPASARTPCGGCGGRRCAAKRRAWPSPVASRHDRSARRGSRRAHVARKRGAPGSCLRLGRTAVSAGAADRPSTHRRATRTPWPHRPRRRETASWDEALQSYGQQIRDL